jgi:hypothetical protein
MTKAFALLIIVICFFSHSALSKIGVYTAIDNPSNYYIKQFEAPNNISNML